MTDATTTKDIEQLTKWYSFTPNEPVEGLKTLVAFLESGDIEVITQNQKDLASLFTFIKDCNNFIKQVEPILYSILKDCSENVSDTFRFSAGAKTLKCNDVNEFLKMCEENNVPTQEAFKFLFSGITMKKAKELFNLPEKYLTEHYSFEIRQNRDRITVK